MSDGNLIWRGDAIAKAEENGFLSVQCIEAIPAVQIAVKPLEWHPTVDGAGWDHGVTCADCPVFEKRFWAETPDKQAKIEAKRSARIRSALIGIPAKFTMEEIIQAFAEDEPSPDVQAQQVQILARALHGQRNSLVTWEALSPGYRGEFELLARTLLDALSRVKGGVK